MRIDTFGCVTMQKDGLPGDIGDSCAETGRFVILGGDPARIDLMRFVSPTGFLRHPSAPDLPDWNELSFTNDQGNFLLMAAFLSDRGMFNGIVADVRSKGWKWIKGGHRLSLESYAITHEWWTWLGVLQVAQMMINLIPFRWSDANDREGFWRVWRFEWATDSTVSFLTTYVTLRFLSLMGVKWPQSFFDRAKYLARAKLYYNNPKRGEPNTAWFTELLENAQL